MSARPPFRPALAGYDPEHKRALVDAISTAIGQTSMRDNNGQPVMALRTAELADALLTVLASTLALSPAATRSPKAIRELCDRLRRCIVQHVAAARADPEVTDFIARCFSDDDAERGGHA